MADDSLESLSHAAGIGTRWLDYRGQWHTVAPDTLRAVLEALGLPCRSAADLRAAQQSLLEPVAAGGDALLVLDCGAPFTVPSSGPGRAGGSGGGAWELIDEQGATSTGVAERTAEGAWRLSGIAQPGYYRLRIAAREWSLAVCPARAFSVANLALGYRPWGLAAQVYSLRSARPGAGLGSGDLGDLACCAQVAARHGADALAISPVHALRAAQGEQCSPYSPSSRLHLNVLLADPTVVFGEAVVGAARRALDLSSTTAALDDSPLIDWGPAAQSRLAVARHLYARMDHLPPALRADFDAFCVAGGMALRDHAHFEALHAHHLALGLPSAGDWRGWPEPLRDPRSAAVQAFGRAHPDALGLHCFLQWLAHRSLTHAQQHARAQGMAIGLVADLAIGTDPGGSHAWSDAAGMLRGVHIGAPPDRVNAIGQEWGLTTFSPRALSQQGYAPYLALLRAQMGATGGLRMDHVLGLRRLWLVPQGASPTQGAYLHYPEDKLLRLLALESWRHRAVVVGEDMGTVPDGFREAMDARGVMGMRVLWFERDWGLFVEPARWPTEATALTTTHDLATVAGWWSGVDLSWRAQLGLLGTSVEATAEIEQRESDRTRLWDALRHAGVAAGDAPAPERTDPVVDSAIAFVAQTPGPLMLVPLEDAIGTVDAPNIPGTIDEHPNWRRRLPDSTEALLTTPEVAARLARVNQLRRNS